MHRKLLWAIQLFSTVLILTACAAGNDAYRPGMDVRADLNKTSKAKFILQVGQRGFIQINDGEYGFELVRMNTDNNVSIELLDTGRQINLSAQLTQPVQLDGVDQTITFELSTVIRGAAIIYVRKRQQAPESRPEPVTDAVVKKIHIAVTILEDTTVHLALDDHSIKEFMLPQGTQAAWEADKYAEIVILEASHAVLEVNETIYKNAAGQAGLHLVVKTRDGKLVVENR